MNIDVQSNAEENIVFYSECKVGQCLSKFYIICKLVPALVTVHVYGKHIKPYLTQFTMHAMFEGKRSLCCEMVHWF